MLIAVEHLTTWLHARFAGSERGASMVEYALLLVLVAVVCIAAIRLLGQNGSATFSKTGSIIDSANAG